MAEVKENEILRSLKVSKNTNCLKNLESNSNYNSDLLSAGKVSSKEHGKQVLTPYSRMDLSVTNNKLSEPAKLGNLNGKGSKENEDVNFSKGSITRMSFNGEKNYISIDEDDSEFTETVPGLAKYNCKVQDSDTLTLKKPTLAKSEAASGAKRETVIQGEYTLAEPLRIDVNDELGKHAASTMDEDVTLRDNVKQVQPTINIRKENPSTLALSNTGMLLVV